jgi:hypothetical protein
VVENGARRVIGGLFASWLGIWFLLLLTRRLEAHGFVDVLELIFHLFVFCVLGKLAFCVFRTAVLAIDGGPSQRHEFRRCFCFEQRRVSRHIRQGTARTHKYTPVSSVSSHPNGPLGSCALRTSRTQRGRMQHRCSTGFPSLGRALAPVCSECQVKKQRCSSGKIDI